MKKRKQKEPLSLRVAKITLAIVITTGLGTIIIGGGILIMKNYNSVASNRTVKPVGQETKNYYDFLEKRCAGNSCCLSSLRYMKDNDYKEADENGECPEGFNRNMMRCRTSYQWCEPIEENCARAGELINSPAGINKNLPDICCEELKGLAGFRVNKNGECERLKGGPFLTCMPCGNGVCDTKFENKCNCLEDCADNALVSCCGLECRQYKYSNCPEGCTKACVGSCPMCKDCDGKGSCYCIQDCDKLGIIDTSNRQTYRNEEFGYEFSYSKDDFSFKEHSTEFLFLSRYRHHCTISFRMDKIKNEQSFSDYLCEKNVSANKEFDDKCEKFLNQEKLSGPGPISKKYLGEKEISENIFAAVVSWSNRGEKGDIYYILNGTEVITILVVDFSGCEEEIDQTLSTFKFIEK